VDVVTALDRLPKVELHCHVEGTMRPDTVVELARKNGIELPTSDPTELYRYSNLDTFLEIFWLVQSTLGSREDWTRLAYESIVDGAAHGLVYRETFFTPARHLDAGQDLAEIVAGLAEGLEAAETETGVRAMLIADIDRAYGPAAGLAMVQRLLELRETASPGAERVIGVGLDSTELGVDPTDFADAFELVGKAGLRRTSHQGEETPPSHIWAGLDVLGSERIDHGLSSIEDPELTARLAGERIPPPSTPTTRRSPTWTWDANTSRAWRRSATGGRTWWPSPWTGSRRPGSTRATSASSGRGSSGRRPSWGRGSTRPDRAEGDPQACSRASRGTSSLTSMVPAPAERAASRTRERASSTSRRAPDRAVVVGPVSRARPVSAAACRPVRTA
jgi:adenosine deaminase